MEIKVRRHDRLGFTGAVPALVPPTTLVMDSFLEAMDEFVAEATTDTQTAGWIEQFADSWRPPAGFAAFLAEIRAQAVDEAAIPAPRALPSPRWWLADATEDTKSVG